MISRKHFLDFQRSPTLQHFITKIILNKSHSIRTIHQMLAITSVLQYDSTHLACAFPLLRFHAYVLIALANKNSSQVLAYIYIHTAFSYHATLGDIKTTKSRNSSFVGLNSRLLQMAGHNIQFNALIMKDIENSRYTCINAFHN